MMKQLQHDKKELRRKVCILELNGILQDIMEQAEGQFKEWRA
jgi:type I restriction enzyme R subunit